MSDIPYWHGKKPFVEFTAYDLPWKPMGCIAYNLMFMIYRPIFLMPQDKPGDRYSCIDGSCICTDLVKQGCVALVHVPGKG